MVALGNMFLNGDGASNLAQVLGQVARNVVLCMIASTYSLVSMISSKQRFKRNWRDASKVHLRELHIVYADKTWTAILTAGLLLTVVTAGGVKSLAGLWA